MPDPQPTPIPNAIPAPVGQPARQAWDKLRGYNYQVWYAILLWLKLPPDQDLFIECAEDADLASDSEITANQLKDQAASISLNTEGGIEAIVNFWQLKTDNPKRKVTFNYITTGDVAREWPLRILN